VKRKMKKRKRCKECYHFKRIGKHPDPHINDYLGYCDQSYSSHNASKAPSSRYNENDIINECSFYNRDPTFEEFEFLKIKNHKRDMQVAYLDNNPQWKELVKQLKPVAPNDEVDFSLFRALRDKLDESKDKVFIDDLEEWDVR
jgi:hypothetical protein